MALCYTPFSLHPEVCHQLFIVVLRCEAGVHQVAFDVGPVLQATVVEHFQFVGDDERHVPMRQALFEHDEAAYAAIAVLEGVDALEAVM